eukprot:g6572.t1
MGTRCKGIEFGPYGRCAIIALLAGLLPLPDLLNAPKAALVVSVTVAAQELLGAVHPAGAATALLLSDAQHSWHSLGLTMGGSVLIVTVGVLFNNVSEEPPGRRLPPPGSYMMHAPEEWLNIYWQKLQGGDAPGPTSVSSAHACFSALVSFVFMLSMAFINEALGFETLAAAAVASSSVFSDWQGASSQPWPCLMGCFVAALCGGLSEALPQLGVPSPMWMRAAFAVGLASFMMELANAVFPAGGAIALAFVVMPAPVPWISLLYTGMLSSSDRVQMLAMQLRAAFGQSDQELTTSALEAFFEHRRGKLTLQEYASEWDLRYEEAQVRAGLEINDIAKTYLFFRNSGLLNKFIEDVKLQIQGDMSRFAEAKRLVLRWSSRGDTAHLSSDLCNDVTYADDGNYHTAEPEYQDFSEDPWSAWFADEDEWSWISSWSEWPVWYADEEWQFDDSGYTWQSGAEEYYLGDEEFHDIESPEHDTGAGATSNDVEDYYNKGKGNSGGCHIRGSRWHHAAQCPVNQKGSSSSGQSFSKGKGERKGKGYNKGFDKGKSKGKGKKGRRPFGKSYGKGKYNKGFYATT